MLSDIRLLAFAVAACYVAASVDAGETVRDEARGFTLSLPDGFRPNAALSQVPKVTHGFVYGDPDDTEPDIMLVIEEMRGTIGRERIKASDLPPGFDGRHFVTRWQGFDVDAFEVREAAGDVRYLTFNVQVPLRKAAIQVKLFGPEDREPELRTLLRQVLEGLRGESNWTRSAAASAVTRSEHYGTILLTVAIVIVVGGLVLLWLVSRSAPRGAVLGIAVTLWMIGFLLGDVRVREVMLVSGSLKMLGFAGAILGIIDALRKRPGGRKPG